MAITPAGWATFTGGTSNVSGSANPSISVSPPTGLSAGDTWIIAVTDWAGSGASWNTPTGFTKQSTSWNDGASQNCGITLWFKPNCTGSETAVTITDTSTAGLMAGASWRQSAAKTATPFIDISDGSFSLEISSGVASAIDKTAASHTPTQDGEIVYLLFGQGSAGENSAGGITWSTPAGFTSLGVANHDTTATGDRASLFACYQVQTTAAAVPVQSSTATFPGNTNQGGALVGVIISFFAGASGATDPFPAGYGHPARAMGNYLSRL